MEGCRVLCAKSVWLSTGGTHTYKFPLDDRNVSLLSPRLPCTALCGCSTKCCLPRPCTQQEHIRLRLHSGTTFTYSHSQTVSGLGFSATKWRHWATGAGLSKQQRNTQGLDYDAIVLGPCCRASFPLATGFAPHSWLSLSLFALLCSGARRKGSALSPLS